MTEDRGGRMKELDEIEEKIHLGNVVSVEPMPERLAPVQNQADMPEIEVAGDDRMKIALRIVDLSNGVLEPEESGRHVALRIGFPPNSNTITVSKRADRVSFYIRSSDLLRKAEEEGFKPVQTKSVAPRDKDRYRFCELGLSDIEAHEALFREIVNESVSVVMDRRTKRG